MKNHSSDSNFKQLVRLLLVLSVAGIALDEFSITVSFFSLKISLILFSICLFLFMKTRKSLDSRIIIFGCVIFLLSLTVAYRSLDLGNYSDESNIEYTIASRTVNLIILMMWAYCLISTFSSYDLQRSYSWLFGLSLLKCIYIVWLFTNGEIDAIFWLPTGEPRFALNRGGMTPNQAGAIWLTIFLYFFYCSNSNPKLSRFKNSFILIVSFCFGTMSGSRSFLIGIFLASFFWLVFRFKAIGFIVSSLFAIAGATTYLLVFPDRGADESALSRFDKWLYSLENIGNNVAFGGGIGSDSAAHNTVLQILSEAGFVGLIGFIVLLYALLVWRGRFLSISFFSIVVPYSFFLMVDIGLLQWQTWLLLATAVVLGRERINILEINNSVRLRLFNGDSSLKRASKTESSTWR